MYSCEICEIFINTNFEEHLQTAVSATWHNKRYSSIREILSDYDAQDLAAEAYPGQLQTHKKESFTTMVNI